MVFFVLLLFIHFFFNATATTEIYTYCHTLSLHYALPLSLVNMSSLLLAPLGGLLGLLIAGMEVSMPVYIGLLMLSASSRKTRSCSSTDRKSTRLNSSH